MSLLTKRSVSALAALAILVSCLSVLSIPAKTEAAAKTYVIVLDPGHDGAHTGAQSGTYKEEDLTLKITNYCKAYLEKYPNVKVYTTRTKTQSKLCEFKLEKTADCLKARPKVAKDKKADLFVSLHLNSSTNTTAKGVEVYTATSYADKTVGKSSTAVAKSVLAELVKLGLTNRGYKNANHRVTLDANSYDIPATLIEHCFMSNTTDQKNFLATAAGLKKLGEADAKGIVEAMGLSADGELGAKEVPLGTIAATGFNGLKFSWSKVANSKGYMIYRRVKPSNATDAAKTDSFEKIATTTAAQTSYVDYTCKTNTTYEYSVKAYNTSYETAFTSKYLSKKSPTGALSGAKVATSTFHSVKISWSKKANATGYRIYRAEKNTSTGKVGSFAKIKTISTPTTTSYTDTTVTAGKTYVYRMRAYHKYAAALWGTYTDKMTITANARKTTINSIKANTKKKPVIKWSKVADASGYRIYRASVTKNSNGTTTTGKFSKVKTVSGNKTFSYTDSTTSNTKYYAYKMRAYRTVAGTKRWGTYSSVVSLTKLNPAKSDSSQSGQSSSGSSGSGTSGGGTTTPVTEQPTHNPTPPATRTAIMGTSQTTTAKMVTYFNSKKKAYPTSTYKDKGAATIEDFCRIVYDESNAEGVRAEVVFAQICKETGFLQFGGDVKATQCNFAGLGATGGGVAGETFKDVPTGVRAQVQHLKAYASTDVLNNPSVDTRFSYVVRGSAPYVEWLGIFENPNTVLYADNTVKTGRGWATAKNYGVSLVNDYIKNLL